MTDQERDRPLKQNSSKLEGLIQLQKRPRFSIIGIWSVTIMVVCLTFWKSAHTQIIPRVNIKGRVIDGSTKKPLFYANVFLANTTRGAATDEDGRFVIDGIPLGTYELVATMMGYDKESKEVIMKEPKDAVVDFQLWPRIFSSVNPPTQPIASSRIRRSWISPSMKHQTRSLPKLMIRLKSKIGRWDTVFTQTSSILLSGI